MRKIIILIIIIIFAIFAFFFVRNKTKKDPDIPKMEEYQESPQEEYIEDLTGTFSETELLEFQKQTSDAIQTYLTRYYAFDYRKTDKNKYLESIQQLQIKENPTDEKIFDDFLKEETRSSYIDYHRISFVVTTPKPNIELFIITDASISSNEINDGKYSILGRIILERKGSSWLVQQYIPSTVYRYGTPYITKDSEEDSYLHIFGDIVGEYQTEGITIDNGTNAAGDKYMQDLQNGQYIEYIPQVPTSTEVKEEYYETLQDAISNDYQEADPGMHD